MFSRFFPVIATVLLTIGTAISEELTALKLCKFMSTEWADGDSFLIQTADGVNHTIRLYGADCIEWHVTDETDARRLRSQRRYDRIIEARPLKDIRAVRNVEGIGEKTFARIAPFLRIP